MSTIHVNPEVLKETGAALVALRRDDLIGSPRPQVHYLHGPPYGDPDNDDRLMSTGGFEPGAMCQYRIGELYQQALGAFYNIYQDLFALTCGTYLLADVYESGDHDKALLFAFLEIDEPPAGLPSYIDPENNSRDAARDNQAAMALNGGPLPPGWEEVPYTEHAAGFKWVTEGVRIYDEHGNLVAKTGTTTYPESGLPSTTTTTMYDENGKPRQRMLEQQQPNGGVTTTTYVDEGRGLEVVEQVTRTTTAHGGSRTEVYTAQRDEQGNLVRDENGQPVVAKTRTEVHNAIPVEQYHEVPGLAPEQPSGRYYNEYYVETYDENGEPIRGEETTIGPQFRAPATGSHQEAAMAQMERENQLRMGLHPSQHDWYGVDEPPPPEEEDEPMILAPGAPGTPAGTSGEVTA